jgi:DNA-binding transcriptional LysR family regulator
MNAYDRLMDFDQLRCFLSVAELGSFSAAARRHFVTQPAISLRMKALEEAVGARLLERSGRSIRLTPAGRLFEPRCRDILRSLERGLADVGELSGLVRGRLAVGAIDAAGIDLLPGLLKRFHEAWPGIELVVRVEPSGPLATALLDGTLDLAIVTLPLDRPGLVVQPLEEETLRLVAPPDRGARNAAALFRTEPLIAYPRGSVTRGLIDEALNGRGLRVRIAMELSHPEAIRGLVTAGLGAAVLPERVIARGGQSLPIVPGLVVRRGLGLVRRGGEEPSAAARAFLDLAGRPVAPARPILPA